MCKSTTDFCVLIFQPVATGIHRLLPAAFWILDLTEFSIYKVISPVIKDNLLLPYLFVLYHKCYLRSLEPRLY